MIEINKKRIINLLTIVVLLLSYSGLWAQSGCASMPAPTTYTKVSEEKFDNNSKISKIVGTAHVNGIVVTRTLENDRKQSYDLGVKYSDGLDAVGDKNPCGNNTKSKHGYPIMDSNRVRILTYEFSQPVTDIELFFAEFGYKQLSGKIDYADIELYHNGIQVPTQLAIRSDCNNGAEIKPGPRLASKSGKVTDVKAGITSNQPFDKMVLRNSNDNTGYGFYVEICFNSIRPQNTSACNPTNINNNFAATTTATKTLNGVEVERVLNASQFANLGHQSYCGSSINYPSNLPYMGDTGARKLTYKFKHPVTSAEIFLFAFGESNKSNADAYDEVKFSVNGGGTMTLSQTYNCMPTGTTIDNNTGKVRSADDKKITTDVGIKVTSTKPFTEIVLDDLTPSGTRSGVGYVVEICASSITKANVDNFITLDAGISNLTNQTVCEGEAPVYKAKADATAFASTAKFDYILEAKKSGTTNWVTVETEANVTPGTVHTFTGDVLKTIDYNNAKVRVKYVYKNSLFPSVTGTAYSNEVTLTVNDKLEISEFKASPATIVSGVATPVTFTIKGTAGAVVTYTVDGGTPQTVSLTGGTATFQRTISQTTDVVITKIQKGNCTMDLRLQLKVGTEGEACSSLPPSLFAKADNATAVINGVTVTRSFSGGTISFFSGGAMNNTRFPGCQSYWFADYPYIGDVAPNSKITYKFSKPITRVQVWLSAFSTSPGNKHDKAKFSVNCGTVSLNVDSSCTSDYNLSGDTIISAFSGDNTNDLGITLSSTLPFTEFTIDALDSAAAGYFVELCPTSLNSAKIKVTQDPTEITTCVGATGKRFTARAKIDGVAATESMSYIWQQTTTPTVESSWVTAVAPSPGGSVKVDASTEAGLTLNAIKASDNGLYYRAKFTFTKCSHTLDEVYSEPAKLNVPSASDIITIVAAQPSNVTTADCTQTTNVSAQGKIADGYTIKNVPARGG